LAWTYKNAGLGFSSLAIVGDRLYTLGAIDDIDYVIALDLKGAKPTEAWKAKIGPIFTFKGNVWGDGPRGTPTVDGKHLYALGGQGELVCVETEKGTVVWRKNLIKDFDGEMMSEWGYSESPLVDGDLVICTPGGAKGTVLALNKKDGSVAWRNTELTHKAPYTSPMSADIAGVRQYVQLSFIDDVAGGVVSGFRAKDGKLLWTQPHFKGHSYSVACSPIVLGNLVYVSVLGSPGACNLYEISPGDNAKFNVKGLYAKKNQKTLRNNHGGVVRVGDFIYGHAGDSGWLCQDLKTGEEKWSEKNKLECASGSLIGADGHLYLFSDQGEMALVKATPDGWQEAGQLVVPEKSMTPQTRPTSRSSKLWAHPVIANGRLYLRDQELIFCYDVREKK
jgi:outer membrane protein assembly factor BamB